MATTSKGFGKGIVSRRVNKFTVNLLTTRESIRIVSNTGTELKSLPTLLMKGSGSLVRSTAKESKEERVEMISMVSGAETW